MKNPIKDEKDSSRVGRGGGWGYDPEDVRTSNRNYGDPTGQDSNLGFRIVRNSSDKT
jgi:formylglycine-generating enzyme required for sulfatase activity